MMYHKAILFQDADTATKIMLAGTPQEHQKLGRQTKNFSRKLWDEHKSRIVEEGNWHKFSNSKAENLEEILLSTGDRELVEVRSSFQVLRL